MQVRETQLPGVGVRHEFDTKDGQTVGVIVHRDGRRELIVYEGDDPDACSTMLTLSPEGSRTMAELLGASQVAEAVSAVRQEIDGLAIEWIQLGDRSPAIGSTIAAGEYRTRTGASIVAVLRGDRSVPAPEPTFAFEAGDTVVAVGTDDGLARLRDIMTS